MVTLVLSPGSEAASFSFREGANAEERPNGIGDARCICNARARLARRPQTRSDAGLLSRSKKSRHCSSGFALAYTRFPVRDPMTLQGGEDLSRDVTRPSCKEKNASSRCSEPLAGFAANN